MVSSVLYELDEVAKHNKSNDCWLIISGKVYDVTSFMDHHPGGAEVLLSSTGKDATSDFRGHTQSAIQRMEKYCIGEVDPATVTTEQDRVMLRLIMPICTLGLYFWLTSVFLKSQIS
ncbi:Cytochrome b5 [Turnera subulata]|uniref:Cytochrome b5 n=1 Tax=Turnera subulata TaxID=218843 RepID=A0A9Q0JGC6_9ROSI|nr:Cytochrome b5 [Turnera subulata]